MIQPWNIKSRAHQCARTERHFEEGETFHTAIHFDTATGEFVRRDISEEAWADELAEHGAIPFSHWKTVYAKPDSGKPKFEGMGSKASAEEMLRQLAEEDDPKTENARYILAIMLERKKLLVPKETKYTEQGTIVLYEHRKTGEVFIIRDPELRLDEVGSIQEEVAMLLGGQDAMQAPVSVAPATAPANAPISNV